MARKFGIAANTYGDLDISSLALAQAKAIYHRDWWLNAGMDTAERALQAWPSIARSARSTTSCSGSAPAAWGTTRP
jgi:hypothetical protein